jgi:hypothetical protein
VSAILSTPARHHPPAGSRSDPWRTGRPAETEAPAAPVTARYRYLPADDTWWWAPEMFELHGLTAGTEQPCTDLFLRHQHPRDRVRVQAALDGVRTDGRGFSLQTRLLRSDGIQRVVVVLGEPRVDESGRVTGLDGMCVDVTDGRGAPDGDRVQELETEVAQLRTAMASRAAIEQAKGILMLLTSCNDQVAFELLAHISSHTHRKVREVATAITASASGHGGLPADIRAILHDACPPTRHMG